jgi:hypothetical protein
MHKPVTTDEDSGKLDYFSVPQTISEGCEKDVKPSRPEVEEQQTDFNRKQGKTFVGYIFIEPD